MIPGIYVEQWRKNAPWQTLAMVEQDLIISRALVDLYNHKDIAEALVFRGGTALNKIYINPPARYSEDIDLVQIKSGTIGFLMDAIRDCLSWLGEPKRKLTERSAKLVYRYTSLDNMPGKLKIEINTTEHFHLNPLKEIDYQVNSEWFVGTTKMITYELEELMATKVKALYERRKGRDLFDLWLVLDRGLVDPFKVLDLTNAYCKQTDVKITRALFEKSLHEKCQNTDFQSDMSFLLANSSNWNFQHALAMVYDHFVSHLPGDPWKEKKLLF
ncbi:MAG: nucleotidyl transferase AbiEii/AbiGii toxin family protein [Alphaproteobacteria bacterium]|nr:nucleotidyl transferase AbiEii/AbiGii toxin family protein [Alphaproteobacteria bacterium]